MAARVLCQAAECYIATYVRVALATSDVQRLEIPAPDEIHMEDRNYGLART